MLGTIVNTGCIIVGSIVGSLLKKGLGEKYQNVLYNAMLILVPDIDGTVQSGDF